MHTSRQSLQWHHSECNGVSNHQPHDCLLNRLFRRRSKKTSKLRATGLCAGNSPVTGEFPAQMASNAENVSIWWRHHGCDDLAYSTMRWFDITQSIILSVQSSTMATPKKALRHYSKVMWVSQITSNSTVYSKESVKSTGPLLFMRGSHRPPVCSPHKWPVMRKLFPCNDGIMMMC